MIHVALEQAVACYLGIFVLVFIGAAAFSLLQKRQVQHTKEMKLWQCSICTFVYSSVFDKPLTVCPRCGSYNKKSDEDPTHEMQ